MESILYNLEIIYNEKSDMNEKAKIALFVEVGSFNDEKKSGIAHFVEHMLVMGLNDYLVYLNSNITVSATTDFFATIYYIECENDDSNIQKALEIAELIISGKTLNMFYIETVREDVLKEYDMYVAKLKKNPYFILFNQLNLPINLPIGQSNVVRNIKYEDIIEFFQYHYKFSNKWLIVFGDCRKKHILKEHIAKKKIKNTMESLWDGSNINKYAFVTGGYKYIAWGNILCLMCPMEKIDVLHIAIELVVSKYYSDVISSIELCSYGMGSLFFLIEIKCEKLAYSENKLIKSIMTDLDSNIFDLAKKKYYQRKIQQKENREAEMQDILFSVSNKLSFIDNENIKNLLEKYSFNEFRALILKIFNV